MAVPEGQAQSELQLRQQIVELGRRLSVSALIVANEGNISARLGENRFLITPAGLAKGKLAESDMVIVDSSGNLIAPSNRKPSSELGMHLCVYRLRSDIHACVHAHPPYAVACSVAGVSLVEPVLPEVVAAIGNVALAEYATPGTNEVAGAISRLVGRHSAVILKNHGALTIGPDLETALFRMEMVEHLAQVVFLAQQLGRVDTLSQAALRKLTQAIHGTSGLPGQGAP